MKKLLLAVGLFVYCGAATADSLGRVVHIKRIFSEGSTTAGFYIKESLPECLWGLMYIDLSKESGKAIFSLVLTAKTADQSIVRIDYKKDESGKCLVSALHTE
ncbi:hypothetical protein [Agaribacterium haliotis]|uniref:hypothetical protein n=1 Tax=Agaribacterium haliotis TaxID=2013869 RepID=UPI001177E055|nr:hypothetical protein [Agaribacterium haliotis]